ncbi:MAG TPA: serine hydrolase domain-containing protein [Gemmatimonadaceae bacterium]|nr:serine hydrolase domain-containing protein [Gemmatimonadaceae bacterium]
MFRLSLSSCAIALSLVAAGPLRALPADTVATALGVRLDSALRRAERRGFSGVVRIERDGVLLVRKGYGLANRARRIPFTDASVVQIGSNTKDFTLVALLRLQRRGRLRLRDSLGKYFPAAPADKRGITLQQLVDHRGGFPIGLGGDFEPTTREQFVERALAAPLRAQPGTREIYSNTGYALLAAVIEQVTGTSYDAHVRDDLLVPLGLENTGSLLPRFDPDRVAHGYLRGEDQGNILRKPHAADGPYWNLRGNGGMVSTVDDMHAFYRALFDGERLLPREARGDRYDPTAPVGLAGSDLVHFFLFERLPGRRIEIIIATNSAEAPAPMIRDAIAPLLGLPNAEGRGGGGAPAAPPPDARAPEPAVAALIRNLIAAVNASDSVALVRVITERFVEEGGPPVEQRVARLRVMRDRLGTLTPASMWLAADGTVHVALATANEGPATFVFEVVPGSPPKLRAMRVMVGG